MDALQTTIYILWGALVIWRVGRILISERGPFDVFENIRLKLGVYAQSNWLQAGLMCILCLTFWPCMVFGFWLAWSTGAAWYAGLVYGLVTSGLIVLFANGD